MIAVNIAISQRWIDQWNLAEIAVEVLTGNVAGELARRYLPYILFLVLAVTMSAIDLTLLTASNIRPILDIESKKVKDINRGQGGKEI